MLCLNVVSCLISFLGPFPEPHAGFKIAFNMFDADGNKMVDKWEFLVVCNYLKVK